VNDEDGDERAGHEEGPGGKLAGDAGATEGSAHGDGEGGEAPGEQGAGDHCRPAEVAEAEAEEAAELDVADTELAGEAEPEGEVEGAQHRHGDDGPAKGPPLAVRHRPHHEQHEDDRVGGQHHGSRDLAGCEVGHGDDGADHAEDDVGRKGGLDPDAPRHDRVDADHQPEDRGGAQGGVDAGQDARRVHDESRTDRGLATSGLGGVRAW
jgi:hypothetical protein